MRRLFRFGDPRRQRLGPLERPPVRCTWLGRTAALIDVQAETARLRKSLAKSEKDAQGLRKRLDNPKFVQNAEPEVIEETRDKLVALDDDIARLNAALAQLAAM